jgi:hypothetical protein
MRKARNGSSIRLYRATMQDPNCDLRMSSIDDSDLSIDTAIRAIEHCFNLCLENVGC